MKLGLSCFKASVESLDQFKKIKILIGKYMT